MSISQASIALTPNAYKANKIYCIKPTNGDADLTFTRAGELPSFNATRVNESGLIGEVLSNVPRLDYSGGGCPSFLLEPQSTNLFTYSEQFDDVSWTNQRVNSVLENIVNPKGEIGTYYLKEDTTSTNSHEIFQGGKTITAGAIITKSIYVKRKEGVADRYLRLQFCDDTFANGARCVFDLQNNIMTTTLNYGLGTLASSKVEDYGNGWFRISLSSKIDDTSTICRSNFYLQNQGGIGASYTGDGVSGCYIFGAQLEASPYTTSYIPTIASAVTRVEERVFKTGLTNYINSVQGAMEVECNLLGNQTDTVRFSLSDGSTNNRISLALTSAQIKVFSIIGGSGNASISYDYAFNDFTKFKVTWNTTIMRLFVNDVEVITSSITTPFTPNLFTKFSLDTGTASNFFYGKVKQIKIYNE